jgi:DNA polymerase I-like protein with 3'-5' exonuclease and polymerase domains
MASLNALLKSTSLPNVRKFFVPDPNTLIFDIDLAGADAQVVAWEANDAPLKEAFRAYQAGEGPKLHCVNAISIFGAKAGPDGKKEPCYTQAKMGVHLTNYGGSANTCAAALGIPVREAQAFQDKWFTIHPDIWAWRQRVENELLTSRSVHNAFGFYRHYFDRLEMLLPQALAWIPQSTVAIVIDTIFNRICRKIPAIGIELQVHDSLVGVCPLSKWKEAKQQLKKISAVTIPYDDPLVIPLGLKTSPTSWGDCEDEDWGFGDS